GVPVELEIGFAGEQPRLRADDLVLARCGRAREHRGLLPLLLLEGGVRQIEGGALRERVVGKLLAQAAPRRVLIARAPEPAGDRRRLVQPLGRRRRLADAGLVRRLQSVAVADSRERLADRAPRTGRELV